MSLWTARVGVFAFLLLCTVIVFGLSANAVAKYSGGTSVAGVSVETSVPAFAGLALAISIITLLTVVPMFVIDFIRRGAITSWVLTELAVLGVLCVLWLATAAESVSGSPFRLLEQFGGCGSLDAGSSIFEEERGLIRELKSLCQQQQALQAFGFLAWLALLGYVLTLLSFAIIASNRGNKAVWQSTVRDTEFLVQPEGNNVAMKQQTVYSQQSFTPTAYTQSPAPTGQYPLPQQQFQQAPVAQYGTQA